MRSLVRKHTVGSTEKLESYVKVVVTVSAVDWKLLNKMKHDSVRTMKAVVVSTALAGGW